MRIIIPFLIIGLAACATPDQAAQSARDAAPDRAIRSFNGASVVIQSKNPAPTAEDVALARTACPSARFAARQFRIEGVSEFLFLC